jgi:glycerate 2-kinase
MVASPRLTPSFSDHRSHLSLLREAALQAVDPAAAVRRALSEADLASRGRIFVVGAGKAGVAMTRAAEEFLGGRIAAGVVSVPAVPAEQGRRVKFLPGGHPIPTSGSLAAGREISKLLEKTSEDDLVLVLISGGGSALMEMPRPGISLQDIQTATAAFLKSGAAIQEINCLRTPLSRIKGGGLARLAHPARVLGLILSDVVGNPLETIASGPTVFRTYSPREIDAVLNRYHFRKTLPPAVLAGLDSYSRNKRDAIPTAARVENRIIASNRIAGEAAGAAAQRLGFRLAYLADDWEGEAREAGKRFAEMLIRESGGGPACCIAGGETTVTVRGSGKGGRNLEAALAAAIALDGKPDLALSTLATDGVDGPTDAAGAVVTGLTVERARRLGMDPVRCLGNNDSYAFFFGLDDLIRIGPTGTNVNDLSFGLIY